MKSDKFYMQKALDQAKLAMQKNEVPIGAVIVDSKGEIVARAYNNVEKKQSQLAHAELLALQKITNKLNNWRLNGYTMFVTLEPCLMCMAAINMHRLKKIVYALPSKLYGFSKNQKFDNYQSCATNINPIAIESGILANESKDLIQSFFRRQRSLK